MYTEPLEGEPDSQLSGIYDQFAGVFLYLIGT